MLYVGLVYRKYVKLRLVVLEVGRRQLVRRAVLLREEEKVSVTGRVEARYWY